MAGRGKEEMLQAVTFDFYNTLVLHRAGTGRGRAYQEYLSAAGLACDAWEHQVLYDVFEFYAASYNPALAEEAKGVFWEEFTRRLFERTHVRGSKATDYTEHAPVIRDIMGPNAFVTFDESLDVLRALKEAGLRLGVISDWQKGLMHFCDELGLGPYLDVVVASGDVGYQKPDPRLFQAAQERMGIAPAKILHVGDRLADVEGAKAAGFAAALLVREGEPAAKGAPIVRDLRELLSLATLRRTW